MSRKRKRSKKVLEPIFCEAMDAAWAVVKKYDLNWTETWDCFDFMSRAYGALIMDAKDQAGIEELEQV